MEIFATKYAKDHAKQKRFTCCPFAFGEHPTMTEIFQHFEVCAGVTNDDKLILGDDMSLELKKKGIQLPSSGSFAKIYKTMSEKLHIGSSLLRSSSGAVVVPADLPNEEKRLLIRFLKASGHDVVVNGLDGQLRLPHDDEIRTPPKQKKSRQPDGSGSLKKKKRLS